MGVVCLLLVALLFSFGGFCVKLISPYFSPSMISAMRLLVGIAWLALLALVTRHRPRADFAAALRRRWPWLVAGALFKWMSYLTENTALSIGVSYGNILTQPVQIIFLTAAGALMFAEPLTRRKRIGIVLCIGGILCISWDGLPLSALLSGSLGLTALYLLSGVGSAVHMLAQKAVSDDFDILDSNFTMFAIASVPALIQTGLAGELMPRATPDLPCVLAILLFGFITGIGFLLNAKAVSLVPLYMVPLLQSTRVFFALLWGVLFFQETVSVYFIGGTALFMAGILIMQLTPRGTVRASA